ncbi:hypothetical protein [Pollutibacter soli]|uniref:hypothetical protein n=1 Tax=Pollutibacter soli TaxID=3034157 RepID=UPI003013710F
MKTKPGLIKASGYFALLLAISFFYSKINSGHTTHDKNCNAKFPLKMMVSGFSLSGHVCGENKVYNMPQVNFRIKGDDISEAK